MDDTGDLVWARPTSFRVKVGDVAGAANGKSRTVGFDGGKYSVAAIKLLYMNGRWPDGFVDSESLTVFNNRRHDCGNELMAVRSSLDYNERTGVFAWKMRTSKCIMIGDVAGSFHKSTGYMRLKLFGKEFLLHRLAWFYVKGVWPSKSIDHIDGNKTNNSIDNLRDVSVSVNGQNLKGATARNKEGVLGVQKRTAGSFRASINVGGENITIGHFKTAAMAHDAYLEEKRRYHAGNTL